MTRAEAAPVWLFSILTAAIALVASARYAGLYPGSFVWRWAAAAPGMNIYVANSKVASSGPITDAMVKRQYFSSFAGIDKSLVEVEEFECARRLTRRKPSRAADATSEWTMPADGTAEKAVLMMVCDDLRREAQIN